MAGSSQRETVVTRIKLNESTMLLGLDGSRIQSAAPPVVVETGPRATPRIWAERVDWSAYAVNPASRIGPTVLRFERGADGARHLCGIAEYDADSVYEASKDDAGPVYKTRKPDRTVAPPPVPPSSVPPPSALPPPDYETRFLYNDDGRLTGYTLRSRAASGRPNPPQHYCLRYDRHGWLAELGANACGEASRPLTHYVHDTAGRLLRTIAYEDRQGGAREVQVFDAKGEPAQRYQRQQLGWEGEHIKLGLPYEARPGGLAVLVLPGPNWAAPAMESSHYDWAIVQAQGDDRDIYAAKRDPAAVLAHGNNGSDGRYALTAGQRQRVWQAAGKTPGGVHWMWAPGQIYTLVQALPPSTWAACTDPDNRAPDACLVTARPPSP